MTAGPILRAGCPRLGWLHRRAWVTIVGTFVNALGLVLSAEPTNSFSARNVAAIVTVYRPNSHADVIVSRLLQTDTLDGKGKDSPLNLVSLYTDQRPADDISRRLALWDKSSNSQQF